MTSLVIRVRSSRSRTLDAACVRTVDLHGLELPSAHPARSGDGGDVGLCRGVRLGREHDALELGVGQRPVGDEAGGQHRPRRGAAVIDGDHRRRLHQRRGVALGVLDDHHRGRPRVVRPVVVDDGGVAGAPAGAGERLPSRQAAVSPSLAGACGVSGAGGRCRDSSAVRTRRRGAAGGPARRRARRRAVLRRSRPAPRRRRALGSSRRASDGEAGLVRGSAASVQAPRDGAGEKHVGGGLAVRERVPPAAG